MKQMSYSSVDPIVRAWAQRHSLTLFTSFADREARFAYTSSKAGECFQIWIDDPADGKISVHAAGVEGRRMDDPPADWLVPISGLDTALEDAWATVMSWMAPSERFLPLGGKT